MRNTFLGAGEAGYHSLRKIRSVISGLRYAVIFDVSVAYKLVLASVLLIAALLLYAWIDMLMILVVAAVVLVAENMNSAIQALCDFVEPAHNEQIKVVKDMSAAAVGIGIFAWFIVRGLKPSRLSSV